MRENWVSLMIAMENNALATWLRSSAWGYPAVETLHILGLALLSRLEQAIAQLLLVLGRGVELGDVGQRVERLEAEELLEEVGGAVEDGAEARSAAEARALVTEARS